MAGQYSAYFDDVPVLVKSTAEIVIKEICRYEKVARAKM